MDTAMDGELETPSKHASNAMGSLDVSIIVPVKHCEAGTALIKSEYIDLAYKPRFVSTYLPDATCNEIQQVIAERQQTAENKDNKVDTKLELSNGDDDDARPPTKKAKLKGRNKKRPFEKRPPAADKLCPSIVGQRLCLYGERCKFSHDLERFMSDKPQGDSLIDCYMWNKYGSCPYGVTCLFSNSHQSLLSEKASDTKPTPMINALSKDLQIRLRKHEYNFSVANRVLRNVDALIKREKSNLLSSRESPLHLVNKEKMTGEGEISSLSDHRKVSDCCMNSMAKVSGVNLADVDPSGVKQADIGCSTAEIEAVDLLETSNTVPADSLGDVKVVSNLATNDLGLPGANSIAACNISTRSTSLPTSSSSNLASTIANSACSTGDVDLTPFPTSERRKIDFRNKLYLAPLTTVGNLPFRRVCRRLGADITCGEMAMPLNLLQGQASEWALLKRHESETLFGIQLCGSYADVMTRTAQVIKENLTIDFIDINLGCPIDLVVKRGEGCALMNRVGRFEQIVRSMTAVMRDIPLTVKMRTGMYEDKHTAHSLLPRLRDLNVTMATLHGRSREQRYTKLADWDYVKQCVDAAAPMPLFGNGDILSFEDYNTCIEKSGAAGCMLARGALIKPWLFTEIKEQRHWDISSSERLDIVREYVNYGLEHWGSDQQGVANTRRFLLEWLSFLHRYIPVGILERVPQRINEKPPHYFGRNDLETLMCSPNCADWIKISEMLLGRVPDSFTFLPKHRANSYA